MSSLYEMSTEYLEAFNSMIDADMDEQTIIDTLEGMQGQIEEKCKNITAFFLSLEAEAKAMKEAEERIRKRRTATESKAETMKNYLRTGMSKADLKNISCAEFSVSIGKPTKVLEVTSEATIPKAYFDKQLPKLNRSRLTKDLKAGFTIEGARLGNGKLRLTIR